MSDPTLKTRTIEDEIRQLIAGRANARIHVSEMLVAISRWTAGAYYLAPLDLASYPKLQSTLHELYSAAGSLMSELAPWKDPEMPGEVAPLTAEPVRIPDDEEDFHGEEPAAATA